MKKIKKLILILIVCFSIASCAKVDIDGDKYIIKGVIYEQGITTHQYGTHIINGYVITSSTVNLNDYINKRVTITGYKDSDYPLADGPDLIEVEKVE